MLILKQVYLLPLSQKEGKGVVFEEVLRQIQEGVVTHQYHVVMLPSEPSIIVVFIDPLNEPYIGNRCKTSLQLTHHGLKLSIVLPIIVNVQFPPRNLGLRLQRRHLSQLYLRSSAFRKSRFDHIVPIQIGYQRRYPSMHLTTFRSCTLPNQHSVLPIFLMELFILPINLIILFRSLIMAQANVLLECLHHLLQSIRPRIPHHLRFHSQKLPLEQSGAETIVSDDEKSILRKVRHAHQLFPACLHAQSDVEAVTLLLQCEYVRGLEGRSDQVGGVGGRNETLALHHVP